MSGIGKLQPQAVWKIFDRITQVPRPSKREGKIIAFLEAFAAEHGLSCRKDAAGNVMIGRPAAATIAGRPSVVLQSHMDMVAEKNAGVEFDFDNDPIQAYVDDGWVRARGTTLGADDGIGMAAALAVLADRDLELPAVEALFTVDEETGLTGAFNLGADMITGKYLINLDSEDEGEIFIGCAGGIGTTAEFPYRREEASAGSVFFRIGVAGLQGGHSGDDIEKGRANSNKIVARLLRDAERGCGIRLARIDGGNLHNAIPREAEAVFAVPQGRVAGLFALYDRLSEEIAGEFAATEPSMDITLSEVPAEAHVIDETTQRGLLDALLEVPNGVLAMSTEMPGLVETSSNLASVKQSDDTIVIVTSQRSMADSERLDAAAAVRAVFERAGAKVTHTDGYPGWKPDPSSHLLEVAEETYETLFGKRPVVRAIHAGLECGQFLEKYPHLEMISIGPTLRGVHSPDERLEIATVDKFWRLLTAILQNIS